MHGENSLATDLDQQIRCINSDAVPAHGEIARDLRVVKVLDRLTL